MPNLLTVGVVADDYTIEVTRSVFDSSTSAQPSRRGWRVRNRALRSAKVLDDVVDAQLALVRHLPEDRRARASEYLAELVMLSQSYRHYAAGWISKRELDQRGLTTVGRLGRIRQANTTATASDLPFFS